LINAGSRSGEQDVSPALDRLRASDLEVLALWVEGPGDIDALIREHAALVDFVVLGGGDGTMNAAAEALLKTRLPFGILPLGTGNDLARSLGIPAEPLAAVDIILKGERRAIDLGCANDRLFFNIATIGLSARVAKAVNREAKRRFGALAYALALARIGLGRPFRATIRTEKESLAVSAIQIAVGNGRYHGGGIVVHEEASIDDQMLHLYALENQSAWRLLGNLPWLLRGKHKDAKGVVSLAARSIDVVTDRVLVVNTDGELTTRTPVRFRIEPQALQVFAPPDASA
jgi:YegS/Rv2252/BmrU family lipid kinase